MIVMTRKEQDSRLRIAIEKAWERHNLGTYREAEDKTGLERTTLLRLRTGERVSRGKIIEWAEGIKEDINYWLKLSGYEPIPVNLLESKNNNKVPDNVREAIDKAGTKEEKINIAFEYVRSTRTKFGSSIMGKQPIEAKYGIIRLYEDLRGVKLLPDDVIV